MRALLLGIGCAAALGVVLPYTDLLVRGSWFGLTSLPVGSVLLGLVLVGVIGPLLAALRQPLSSAEIATVLCMALVAAGVPSFGLTALLMPYLVGPTYYMGQDNHFLQHLPTWAMVQGEGPVSAFYEGLPDNEAVPWAAWRVPLLAWGIQIAAVYTVLFCLTSLLRKPWMEGERLAFPLAELPAALASPSAKRGAMLPDLFREPMLWWFFAVPALLHTLNGLHQYWPSLPRASFDYIPLDPLLTEQPWNKLTPLWIRFNWSVLGIAYFLPTAVSLGGWLFYLFFLVQTFVAACAGAQMPPVQAYPVRAFVAHQTWGGILVSGAYGLWTARRHILAVGKRAFSRERDSDTNEPLSPRATVVGLVVGVVVLIGWGAAAGAGVGPTCALFGLFFLTHIVATRLTCEGGMLQVQHPFRPVNQILATVGTAGLPPRSVPVLTLLDHLWMLDNRSPLMPALMLSQRIAEPSGLPRRRLTWAMAAAVVVAVVVSFWAYLRLMYANGGLLVDPWFSTYYAYNLYGMWTEQLAVFGQPRDAGALWTMGAGAASFAGVLSLYHRYPRWAPSPLGYLMGGSYPMTNMWVPFLAAWVVKSFVLRVGGVQLYRRLQAGFLGLILADYVSAAVWTAVGAATRTEPYRVFAF